MMAEALNRAMRYKKNRRAEYCTGVKIGFFLANENPQHAKKPHQMPR